MAWWIVGTAHLSMTAPTEQRRSPQRHSGHHGSTVDGGPSAEADGSAGAVA
jgi:hypothetical protein